MSNSPKISFPMRLRVQLQQHWFAFLALLTFACLVIGIGLNLEADSDKTAAGGASSNQIVSLDSEMQPEQITVHGNNKQTESQNLDGVEELTNSPVAVSPDKTQLVVDNRASDNDPTADKPRPAIDYRPAPLPTDDFIDEDARRKADAVLEALTKRVERLDEGGKWLDAYGGESGQKIRTLLQNARDEKQPDQAMKIIKQAGQLLEESLPDMYRAEIEGRLAGRTTAQTLAEVLSLRNRHSDDSMSPQLDAAAEKFTPEQWLELAASQLENASPEESGFVDAWLPIASAWRLVGNEAEVREALRRARLALPRTARVERLINSTIDLCLHDDFNPAHAEPLIAEAGKQCQQVANLQSRCFYYADLAGLAAKLNLHSLSSQLLAKSLAIVRQNKGSSEWMLTLQIKAAAWSESPQTILASCRKLAQQNHPKVGMIVQGYGYAAVAAARQQDLHQYTRAVFQAETALAPRRFRDSPNFLHALPLVEAHLLKRRWRAAVIMANNIPDPGVRASILFRLLRDAPQEVHSPHLDELLRKFADRRWASAAMSGYSEHRVRSGESLLDVVAWAQTLPEVSHRAAAYAGLARIAGRTLSKPETPADGVAPVVKPNINDFASLIEQAEQDTTSLQDPIEAALAWLRIARTQNLLGRTVGYRQAVTHIDDHLFNAWKGVWESRPPVKRSYNGGYIDSNKRHRKDEERTIEAILDCQRRLSKMQADLGDAKGAMDTCLNLAQNAGFLSATSTTADQNFYHLMAIAHRLESETGVSPDVLIHYKEQPKAYGRALIAAWSGDLPQLEREIRQIQDKYNKGTLTRAYAELAILHAQRGELDAYRQARRSALSQISQGKGPTPMKFLLAEADAQAGEFAMANDNLVSGYVQWYGDANRPRSQLAIALARAGKWGQATKHAKVIDAMHPGYRGEAWEAIAQARYRDASVSRESLVAWARSIAANDGHLPIPSSESVGALCGLALAAAEEQQ